MFEVVEQSSEFWDQSTEKFGEKFPYIEISQVGIGTNEYNVEWLPVTKAPSRARMVVHKDEIIMSTTRPHRGAIALIKPEHDGYIASTGFAILKLHSKKNITVEFLLDVLLCQSVLRQFEQRSSGGNYPAITPEQINKVLIPVPSLSTQQKLVADMQAARESRRRKLKQAEELLNSIDDYLLKTLGLTPPPAEIRKVFAVRLGQLKGKRMDAPAYQPLYAAGHAPNIPLSPLSELAFIGTHVIDKPNGENHLVPYIGLPECGQTEIQEVVMRPYSEVKGRSVVKPGDILFARIEPSIFNKKYVLAEDLKGYEYAYTSTEFYVVTPNPDVVEPYYIYAMFFCAFVFNQVQGKTTGSSGRRRLSPDSFRDLQIPIPPIKTQRTIAAEIKRRREEARHLRIEAEAEWSAAKERFEKELLGD